MIESFKNLWQHIPKNSVPLRHPGQSINMVLAKLDWSNLYLLLAGLELMQSQYFDIFGGEVSIDKDSHHVGLWNYLS